jgi:hypothetical protein
MWIVRRIFGLGGPASVRSGVRIRRVDDGPRGGGDGGDGGGRENVRVLPRQDPDA